MCRQMGMYINNHNNSMFQKVNINSIIPIDFITIHYSIFLGGLIIFLFFIDNVDSILG